MRDARGQLVETDHFIERRIGHDTRYQCGVHGVPGALGDHVPEQWPADQGQIADQIQRLVPAALIREPKSARIPNPISLEANRIIERSPANQCSAGEIGRLMASARVTAEMTLPGFEPEFVP